MLRLAVVCAMLCGCNVVFGVDRVEPAVCGPYAVVDQLAFDPKMLHVREISFDADGKQAMAWADYNGTTGPNALMSVDGVWVRDDARSLGLETLGGARLQPDGRHAFGWTGASIDEYQFSDAVGWNALVGVIDTGTLDDKVAGNAIELDIGAGALRLLVETRIHVTGGSEIVLRSRLPSDDSWQDTRYLDAFVSATPTITPGVGLLTADGERFVYAAQVGRDPISHLYATPKNADPSFSPGVRLDIDGVDEGVALTDPWINADCSQLWFNADGEILHARQLAAPDDAQ
jgi:hypothetical protein